MRRAMLLLVLAGCSSGPVPNLESRDPYERYLGALEAADSGRPEEVKKVEALLKDPDPLARTGAVVALAKAKPPGTLALVTGMLSDADPGVRTEAVRAVASFKDASSVPALVAVLDSDGGPVEPKRVAALALGEYGDQPPVREALLKALADRESGVSYNAYRSLVKVTGKQDLPRAREAAEQALKKS